MFESGKNGQYWRELGIMQSSPAVQVMLSEIHIKRHSRCQYFNFNSYHSY